MVLIHDRPVGVIDADSHVLEPADLWTSRVPARLRDQVPRVERNPVTEHHHWRIGDTWLWPVGHWGQAGWNEYPPMQPWEFEDVQPGTYDPVERLKKMDEYGVEVQILYPNLVGFQAQRFADLPPDVSLLCVRAYNDFLLEWSSADPARLVPIAMLPYWNRDECVRELERCVGLGFRGVMFANKFEKIGLPSFVDPYWDPVYAAAQHHDVPISYHIGFSAPESIESFSEAALAKKRALASESGPRRARGAAMMLLGQCETLGLLITSGLCERFPDLRLVSVETGFGQIPFYLEALDWHWQAYGNDSLKLLPSEYFRRQCYGTFWFERQTLPLLGTYPDNFMFSTDYPHPTSLSPGPCSPADRPGDHVEAAFAGVDEQLARKAISENARRVYRLG